MGTSDSTARSIRLEAPPKPKAAEAATAPESDKLREMDRTLAGAAEAIASDDLDASPQSEKRPTSPEPAPAPTPRSESASVSLADLLGSEQETAPKPATRVEEGDRAAADAEQDAQPRGDVVTTIGDPPPGVILRTFDRINRPWHRLPAELQQALLIVGAVTLAMSIVSFGIAFVRMA